MTHDLVVLELASVLAGPSVGQFFAELGARVVKIENPRGGGDVTRSWRLPVERADGFSAYFAACNFGKESITLALDTEEGRAVLHRLVRSADIVISSFAPGSAHRLGADPETLCSLNPRLIHGTITGYGAEDERTGYDAVLQAETGFMHMNGPADGEPTKMPVALIDLLAAHQLKEGLLLALWRRERTGRGDAISVSLRDAAVASLANQATNWLNTGHDPQRLGSEHPNIAPYGSIFGTADDHLVVLAVGTDAQFEALCSILDLNRMVADPRFRTNQARVTHRAELNTLLGSRISTRTRTDLLDDLTRARVPAGAIRPVSEVFEDPPSKGLVLGDDTIRGIRQIVFRAESDRRSAADDAVPVIPALPPRLGQHTAPVLAELAGVDDKELRRLSRAGALGHTSIEP